MIFQAAQNIREGKGGGGAYSGYTRATELQGRELGMFNQKHFHEHTHEIVPDKALLERLSRTNPALAKQLAGHLGVVFEGECELIVDDNQDE